MITDIIRQEPYRDDYDRAKGYVAILGVPDRVLQAREFTQAGTIIRDQVSMLGNAVLNNGHIISGLTISIKENIVTIQPGSIWLDGSVRTIKDVCRVNITGRGSEFVGSKIISSIVTEDEDPTLLDPAENSPNYNKRGSHRLKEEVKFVLNEGAPIWLLENGSLVKEKPTETSDLLTEILARRTNDESGHYKVSGLKLSYLNETNDVINVQMSEGKAYVRGYEVVKPTVTNIAIDQAKDTRLVLSEPKVYSNSIEKYQLNNQPIDKIKSIVVELSATETVTRGNVGGSTDYLTNTSITKVVEVKQDSKKYVNGESYQLTADGIDWSLSGDEPSPGTNYTVTYQYKKTLDNTQYELLHDESNQYFIKFSSLPIVHNTEITISYTFRLSRIDLVCMDRNGIVKVVKGIPDVYRSVVPPVNQDNDLIDIGYVIINPYNLTVNTNNIPNYRLTMEDLYYLSKRVSESEYNQAIEDLDNEALMNEQGTDLKGVYTDGFIGFTKADVTHDEYNASMDFDLGVLLPAFTSDTTRLIPNLASTNTTAKLHGRLATAPYKEVVAYQQSSVTNAFLVNPYDVYRPDAIINLDPAVDNWIDTKTIIINKEEVKTNTVYKYNPPIRRSETRTNRVSTGSGLATETTSSYSHSTRRSKTVDTNTELVGTTESTASKLVLDEAIPFMRENEVSISASGLTPYERDIQLYFNRASIPMTATGNSKAGTAAGSVNAGPDGTLTAKFTIPHKTPCGTVPVELVGSTCRGSAVYTSKGRNQTVEDTVTTTKYFTKTVTTTDIITDITTETLTTRRYDPLAQSIFIKSDCMLTSVGLYFMAKDTEKPVIVQVRNVVDGFPSSKLYDQIIIPASDINVSTNGTVETVVKFSNPLHFNEGDELCFSVISDSPNYQLAVATVGLRDLLTGQYIKNQPYLDGTMYSSSNNQAWTIEQSSDIKFNLYKAEFIDDGVIEFKPTDLEQFNRVELLADSIDYHNSGVTWEYKLIDGDDQWTSLTPYIIEELSDKDKMVVFRVTLKHDKYLSPILATDAINLVRYSDELSSAYINRNIVLSSPYNKIKVYLDCYLPSGCSINAYVENEEHPRKSRLKLSNPTISPINETWSQYEWNYSSSDSCKNFRLKLEFTSRNKHVRPMFRRLMCILKY